MTRSRDQLLEWSKLRCVVRKFTFVVFSCAELAHSNRLAMHAPCHRKHRCIILRQRSCGCMPVTRATRRVIAQQTAQCHTAVRGSVSGISHTCHVSRRTGSHRLGLISGTCTVGPATVALAADNLKRQRRARWGLASPTARWIAY